MQASEIIDRDSFRKWLESQPLEVAQVIAARAALRVFPVVLGEVNSEKLNEHVFADLTKFAFRATFISWAARNYPTHDMKPAAAYAAHAPLAFATAEAAGYAAAAARNAANAAYAVANVTSVATNAATNAASNAAFAASSARAVTNDATAAFDDGYAAVRADGEWLERTSGNTVGLIGQLLWLPPSNVPDDYKDLQDYLAQKLANFRQSDFIAQHPSFGLVSDWYATILPISGTPRSLFGEEKDILLATQRNKFWEGDPFEVMDRVAELVGWHQAKLSEYSFNLQYGVSFIQHQEFFWINESSNEDDFSIARKFYEGGRTDILLKKAERLKSAAARLGNQPGWGDLTDILDDLIKWLKKDPEEMAKSIAVGWDLSVSLGTFAEQDEKLKDPKNKENTTPLSADTRRPLDDLLSSISSAIREFPSGQKMDEQHFGWRGSKDIIATAQSLLKLAQRHEVLFHEHAKLLEYALNRSDGDGTQSQKNAAFGSGSMSKLAIAVVLCAGSMATLVAEETAKEVTKEVVKELQIGKKAANLIREGYDAIEEMLQDAPADVKASAQTLIAKAKDENSAE